MTAAAVEMTRLCTGEPPHPMTELYGARALDVCFDGSMGMGAEEEADEEPGSARPHRVSSMTTPALMARKLGEVFGAGAAPPGGWAPHVLDQMVANSALRFHFAQFFRFFFCWSYFPFWCRG